MSILINNNTYSYYRVTQMLNSKIEATKLRGWDRFKEWTGLGDKGESKKIQLEKLYEELHFDTLKDNKGNEVNNDNLNRLIVFNKMSKLVNESSDIINNSQVKFSVLIDSPNGLASNIIYKVGNHNLLTTYCTPVEKRNIRSLQEQGNIDRYGNLQSTLLTEKLLNVMTMAVNLSEEQANKTMIRNVRDFQKRLKLKPINEYGIKQIKYDYKNKTNTYIVSRNNVAHVIPEKNINPNHTENQEAGIFKTVVGKNSGNVLFEQNTLPLGANLPKLAFSSHEVEKILLDNNIKSFKGTTQISKDKYIAHNAGDHNLYWHIQQGHTYPPNNFGQILQDMKTLHGKYFYHLDIKPKNIQMQQKNENQKPNLIDLDSFSSLDKLVTYSGSPLHSNWPLFKKHFIDKKATSTSLQTADEFALALSLMEAHGVKIPRNNMTKTSFANGVRMRDGDMTITAEINVFIKQFIVQKHQDSFIRLIKNPFFYSENKTSNLYLLDMFIIGNI